MNVKRFTARNSREAMALVRQAFGDEAVVLSNKPCPEGVEVLAMAPEGMSQIERVAASTPRAAAAAPRAAAPRQPAAQPQRQQQREDVQPRQALKQRLAASPAPQRAEPGFGGSVGEDVNAMAMSTLSFQDYVRERMLKRRSAEMNGLPDPMMDEPAPAFSPSQMNESVASMAAQRDQRARSAMQTLGARRVDERAYEPAPAPAPRVVPPVLRDEIRVQQQAMQDLGGIGHGFGGMGNHPLNDMPASSRREQEMMTELRAMKGMIEERFGALAFMEKLQRQPAQALVPRELR